MCVYIACKNGANVVFAVATTNSQGYPYIQQLTQFIGTIVSSLDVDSSASGPTISRIGLVTYDTSATVRFNLNTYNHSTDIQQALNVPYTGSPNNAASQNNLAAAIK